MVKRQTLPATAGILRAAVAAVQEAADGLGDLGDREAAVILDECAARATAVLGARVGREEKQIFFRRAVSAVREAAENLCDAGDPECAMIFAEALGRVNSLLDARAGPPSPENRATDRAAERNARDRRRGHRGRPKTRPKI